MKTSTASTDDLSTLALREPRQRPDMKTISSLVTRAVAEGSANWQRIADAYAVLMCDRPDKDGSGVTGVDSNNRLTGPWQGSSDVDVALAEEVVNEKTKMLRHAISRGQLAAVPTETQDAQASGWATMELMYYLNGPMRRNVRPVLAQAAKWQQCYGNFWIGLGWRRRLMGVTRVLSLTDLWQWAAEQGTEDFMQEIQAAMQAGGQLTPQEVALIEGEVQELEAEAQAALAETIFTKAMLGELAAVLEMYEPAMCEGESIRVARALQRGEVEVEYCAAEIAEDCPEWRPLRPGVDVLFPATCESGRAAETEWALEPLWGTAREIREMAAAEGWDETATEELLKHPGVPFGLWSKYGDKFPWLLSATNVGQSLPFELRESEMFCPVLFTYRAISRAGIGCVYQCVVHDQVEKFLKHEMLNTVDGLMPYEDIPRDIEERLAAESRGLAEMVKPYQNQAKDNTDAWFNMVSLKVKPPIIKPYGLASTQIRSLLRPGGEIEARRGEEGLVKTLNLGTDSSIGLGKEKDEHLRLLVARRFGLRHKEVDPEFVQAMWQVEVDDFTAAVGLLCRRTYAMIQEYGPEEIYTRVTEQPRVFAGTRGNRLRPGDQSIMRAEIRGAFDFSIEFDTRNLVLEWVATRGKLYAEALSIDTLGAVPRIPILTEFIGSFNPKLAGQIMDAEEANDNQVTRTMADLAAIVTGQKVPDVAPGQNHTLALQIIQEQAQTPLMQQYLQIEQIAKVMENYWKQHSQFVKQEQNKKIGRTGGRPGMTLSLTGNGQ